jgi:hypothetical protein
MQTSRESCSRRSAELRERNSTTSSDDIVNLAEDRHANFVIQKLFEVSSPVQRQRILELLSGSISRLARNSFGTRVLQSIVMSGEVQHQSWVLEEIEDDFLGACSDEHANWLVLKLFQLCPDFLIVRFMDMVVPICMEMIDNRFGCRVVLVILERFLPLGYPRGNPNAPEQKALLKTSAVRLGNSSIPTRFQHVLTPNLSSWYHHYDARLLREYSSTLSSSPATQMAITSFRSLSSMVPRTSRTECLTRLRESSWT